MNREKEIPENPESGNSGTGPRNGPSVELRERTRPTEADLEKLYEAQFKDYEEWRASQVGESPSQEAEDKKSEPPKRQGFGRMDLIFIVLGFLVALLWRGCSAPK